MGKLFVQTISPPLCMFKMISASWGSFRVMYVGVPTPGALSDPRHQQPVERRCTSGVMLSLTPWRSFQGIHVQAPPLPLGPLLLAGGGGRVNLRTLPPQQPDSRRGRASRLQESHFLRCCLLFCCCRTFPPPFQRCPQAGLRATELYSSSPPRPLPAPLHPVLAHILRPPPPPEHTHTHAQGGLVAFPRFVVHAKPESQPSHGTCSAITFHIAVKMDRLPKHRIASAVSSNDDLQMITTLTLR